jgi:hypothetical protein
MNTQEFLKPRLVGHRFDGHTLPMEILKDFSALEEMIVEVAKWCFLKDHPASKRVQPNFSKGMELHLAQIDKGSTMPAFVLSFSQLVAPANAVYFEQAKALIIESIEQAAAKTAPTLLPNHLSYFDRFGRGLRDGESVEFSRANATTVVYTPAVRKQLIKFSQMDEWTEEISLRGRIPEADQVRNSFHLELRNGTKLQSPWANQHHKTVLDAFTRYRDQPETAFVLIQGIVKKDRKDKPISFESVEHITPLDPLDVTLRLEEISELKDGWLDGKGIAPSPEKLRELATLFETHFDTSLKLPHLYPTAEGGIQAEWSLPNDWEVTLEIDLNTKAASYQAVSLKTKYSQDLELDLSSDLAWKTLNELLTKLGGVEA